MVKSIHKNTQINRTKHTVQLTGSIGHSIADR